MINLINISRFADGSEKDPAWLKIRSERIDSRLPSYLLDKLEVETEVLEELWTRAYEKRVETFLELIVRDIERQAALAYDELLVEELF